MTDEHIITRIKAGDIDQYSHLVTRHHPTIHRYIRSKLFDKGHADDLAQVVFIKFYSSLDRFDPARPVLPYLYVIAANELKMHYRSLPAAHISLDKVPESHLGTSTGGLDDLTRDHEVSEAMKLLTPDQRNALTLYADGYKYHEIAILLKKPVNTIRTLIRRARLLIQSS